MSISEIEFIGEIGVNHNGDVSLAKELLYEIANSGGDTAKLQLFKSEFLVSPNTRLAKYQMKNGVSAGDQASMLDALALTEEEVFELNELAVQLGINLLITPFDLYSLKFILEDLEHKRVKFSSGDLTYHRLIFEAARQGASLIISTGMSSHDEVEFSVKVARAGFAVHANRLAADFIPTRRALADSFEIINETKASDLPITLLHCTSTYPAPIDDLNVAALTSLKSHNIPVGYSDHSEGSIGAILALALGARTFEKHVTLSKFSNGPDHAASSTPEEFRNYINILTEANKALGDGVKRHQESEIDVKLIARRGVYASTDIRKGEQLGPENVIALRPVSQVGADLEFELYGRRASIKYKKGEPIHD